MTTHEVLPEVDRSIQPSGSSGVSGETRSILRIVVLVLAVAALLWILYALESILFLLILSIFFAYLVAPLVELVRRVLRFNRGSQSRSLAAGTVYLLLLGSVGFGVYLVLPRLENQVTSLVTEAPSYLGRIQSQTHGLSDFYAKYRVPSAARRMIDSLSIHAVDTVEKFTRNGIMEIAASLVYLPWLAIIPILAFFFLKDAEKYQRALGRVHPRARALFQEVHQTLAAYIRAQLFASLLIGTICWIGFFVIGIPYALVLAVLAGVLEFIPLLGPLIVMIVATLLGAFSSATQAITVLIFLLVLRGVEDYVVYPKLIGSGIHLHPVVTILGILSGAEIAGVAGVFLSIPFIAIFSVVYRHWLEETGSEGLVKDLLKTKDTNTVKADQTSKPSRSKRHRPTD